MCHMGKCGREDPRAKYTLSLSQNAAQRITKSPALVMSVPLGT